MRSQISFFFPFDLDPLTCRAAMVSCTLMSISVAGFLSISVPSCKIGGRSTSTKQYMSHLLHRGHKLHAEVIIIIWLVCWEILVHSILRKTMTKLQICPVDTGGYICIYYITITTDRRCLDPSVSGHDEDKTQTGNTNKVQGQTNCNLNL